MAKSKLSISHFFPRRSFGGVEIGIYKSYLSLNEEFNYNVYHIKGAKELNICSTSFTKFLADIFFKKQKNGIVITSLWPCHVFGFISFLLNQKWIMFLHSEKYHSFIDKVVTSFFLRLCNNFLCDSSSSLDLLPHNKKSRSFIVPYIFLDNKKSFNPQKEFDISWVGRNSYVKRLDLLVLVLKKLLILNPHLKILLIISGHKSTAIEKLSDEYVNNFCIYYNILPNSVSSLLYQSKVSLCLSDYEGFSMSTVESILNYNVIAARKVGDLPSYLSDDFVIWLNDLSTKDFDTFCSKIINILSDKNKLVSYQIKCNDYFNIKFKNKDYLSSFKFAVNSLNKQSSI